LCSEFDSRKVTMLVADEADQMVAQGGFGDQMLQIKRYVKCCFENYRRILCLSVPSFTFHLGCV